MTIIVLDNTDLDNVSGGDGMEDIINAFNRYADVLSSLPDNTDWSSLAQTTGFALAGTAAIAVAPELAAIGAAAAVGTAGEEIIPFLINAGFKLGGNVLQTGAAFQGGASFIK